MKRARAIQSTIDQVRSMHSDGRSLIWVGALSFEDRCINSLEELSRSGLSITKAFALDYGSASARLDESRERREKNRRLLHDLADQGVILDGINESSIDPYNFNEFRTFMESSLNSPDELYILDVSCMTKLHTLALGSVLAELPEYVDWFVAYTVPENYGDLAHSSALTGWKDILIAPLAETATMLQETGSRGILVLGHEEGRLIVGLEEIEPSGGAFIYADTRGRPDLRHQCKDINSRIVKFRKQVLPREWHEATVPTDDPAELNRVIREEIAVARSKGSPVILFPFGPKPLILFSAMQLTVEYSTSSWFVYPVPSGYDSFYSEGSDRTVWYANARGILRRLGRFQSSSSGVEQKRVISDLWSEFPPIRLKELDPGLQEHLKRLIDDRRLFSVVEDGETVIPPFQLLSMTEPLEAVRRVLAHLGDRLSDRALAVWFVTPSGKLRGARPVDRLREAPEEVISAAYREFEEMVF